MSSLNLRSSHKTVLIAAGWLFTVICAVHLGDRAIGSWNLRMEDLERTRERLSRLHGWLAVEQDLAAREEEALGPLAHSSRSELNWSCLEGLQSLARTQGLSVKELRPSETESQGNRPAVVLWDIRLEGPLDPLGQFLQQIPDKMPGARLESLQLLPQEKGGVQALLRLSIPVWEPS